MATWEPLPSYWELVVDSFHFIMNENSFQDNKISDIKWQFNTIVYLYPIIGALVMTIIYHYYVKHVTRPIGIRYHLNETQQLRFDCESWGVIFCIFITTFVYYSVCWKRNILQRPSSLLNYVPGTFNVSWDIILNYFLLSSYSIHETLLYFGQKKNEFVDWFLHMIHHIITLTLIFVSYELGYQLVGLQAVAVFYPTVIFIKCYVCLNFFRLPNGKDFAFKKLRDLVFLLTVISWAIFRLYLFPLRVMYWNGPAIRKLGCTDRIPFALSGFLLFFVLFILNIFWFNKFVKRLWSLILNDYVRNCKSHEL